MKLLKEIIFPLLAIMLVVIIPHTGLVPLPFGYCLPVLLFTWLYLRYHKENFSSLGFSLKRFSFHALLTGTLGAVCLIVFLTWVFFPLLKQWTGLPDADLGDIGSVRHNTPFFLFLLAMGWIVGGFYEELVFHGFIFTRLEKLLPGKSAVPVAFLLTNLIFAAYHVQLGIEGVINAFIAGSFYQALMLYFKRNMWYAIICHAVFDTIALTFLYAGY